METEGGTALYVKHPYCHTDSIYHLKLPFSYFREAQVSLECYTFNSTEKYIYNITTDVKGYSDSVAAVKRK